MRRSMAAWIPSSGEGRSPSPFRFAVLARAAFAAPSENDLHQHSRHYPPYICKRLAHEVPQSPFQFSVVLCLFLVISDFGESRKKIFLLAFCSVLGLMFGVLMMCLFVIT